MNSEIYVELNKKERDVLSKMIDDYKGLFELAKRIREKNARDIDVINYIKYLIGILSKLVKTNSISIEDSKALKEYYIANSEVLSTSKHSSTYEVFENDVLKGIIDKIHKEVNNDWT